MEENGTVVAEVATEATKKAGKGGIAALIIAGTAVAGVVLWEGGKRVVKAIRGKVEAAKAAKASEDSGETQK